MSGESLKKIRRAALNFLARRDYAEAELQRRLEKSGFDTDEIQAVTAGLVRENLLSNSRFIENYVHYRRKKGFGPLKIRAELNEKGLTSKEYEHTLQTHDTHWFSEARMVFDKRFKNRMPDDYATRAKQMRFLQGRGFTSEQIESVFEK